MLIFAAESSQLALAAIPTSIATIVVAYFGYKATRNATPSVAATAQIEPRLADVEKVTAGWGEILDNKDQQIRFWQDEAERIETERLAERKIAEQFAQKADRMEQAYHTAIEENVRLQAEVLKYQPKPPTDPPPMAN